MDKINAIIFCGIVITVTSNGSERMQSRRPLTMIFGLLALSAAASAHAQGLTIINTESAVYEQRANTPSQAARQENQSATRGAPPLPGRGSIEPQSIGSNQGGEEAIVSSESDQAWLLPNDQQEPRQGREPAQGTSASNAAYRSGQGNVATKNRYEIKEEWLSDAVEQIAAEAGYSTTIWAIGQDGESDFSLHSNMTLMGATAKDVLAQLVMPYPIRLCLFNIDNVAKVVAAEESCQ
jgi:hypothetical protein